MSRCATCQACVPDTDDIPDDKKLEVLARAALYSMSPMSVNVLDKTHVNLTLPLPSKMNENFMGMQAIKMPEALYMTCSQGAGGFPNACSGVVPVQITMLLSPWHYAGALRAQGIGLNDIPDGSGLIQRVSETYGMGMYFYSTYEEKTGKVREVIDLRFALGDHGLCSAEARLTSGECFGMKIDGKPRAPADPPKPPVLKDIGPELPQLHAKQVPGLGAGPIILIVMLVLTLLVVAAGGVAFFLRRQRSVQEERALRGVQEVELN
eukprot:s1049_g5.t2